MHPISNATLEIILTDLAHCYHPPTSLPPLEVDQGKDGKPSDHNGIILAPKSNDDFFIPREKKVVTVRPLPESQVLEFGKLMVNHTWNEVYQVTDVNKKVENFHSTLRMWLVQLFAEKNIKISILDKKWCSPALKKLLRKVQREFYKNKKSDKWRHIKTKYQRMKRKSIRLQYKDFLSNLRTINPGKWYQMARQIGAISHHLPDNFQIPCLDKLDDLQIADRIADFYAGTSNNFEPVSHVDLPAYLTHFLHHN